MRGIRIGCFSREGQKKVRYETQVEVEAAKKNGQKIYPCPDCGGWHLKTRRRFEPH